MVAIRRSCRKGRGTDTHIDIQTYRQTDRQRDAAALYSTFHFRCDFFIIFNFFKLNDRNKVHFYLQKLHRIIVMFGVDTSNTPSDKEIP